MIRHALILLFFLAFKPVSYSQIRNLQRLNQNLITACSQRDHDQNLIAGLLAAGAQVNSRDENGATPLMWSALWADYNLFQLLLKYGANPELNGHIVVDEFQLGSLLTASIYGAHYHQHDYRILQWLTENPQIPLNKPDYIAYYKTETMTPLHAAAAFGEYKALELILAQKKQKHIDVNASCTVCNGKTPLMFAAEREGKPEFSQILLANGANPGLRDKDQRTAFDYAQLYGGTKVIDVMAGWNKKQPISDNRFVHVVQEYLPVTISESFEQAAHQAIIKGDSAKAKALYSKALTQLSYDYEIDLLDGFEYVKLSDAIFNNLSNQVRTKTELLAGLQKDFLNNQGVESPRDLRRWINYPDSLRIDRSFNRVYPLYAKLRKFFPTIRTVDIEAPVTPSVNYTRLLLNKTSQMLRSQPVFLKTEYDGNLDILEKILEKTALKNPEEYTECLILEARQAEIISDTAKGEVYWKKSLDFVKQEWKNKEAVLFTENQAIRSYIRMGNFQYARYLFNSSLLSGQLLPDTSYVYENAVISALLNRSTGGRRNNFEEITNEFSGLTGSKLMEINMFIAESYEEELNFSSAVNFYIKAAFALESYAAEDPLFSLLCYKTAWCYFKSGNYDDFKIWQSKALALRLRTPTLSSKIESIEQWAIEYKDHNHQLSYKTLLKLNHSMAAKKPGTEKPDDLIREASGDFTAVSQLQNRVREECEWLIKKGDFNISLSLLQQITDRYKDIYPKSTTWLKLHLLKAHSLRELNRLPEALELLQWLEKETTKHLGIFSGLMSDVYFEQLELYQLSNQPELLLDKLMAVYNHQRNRQMQIPTFLLDNTEYDLYLQFNQKYISQFTSLASVLSATHPQLKEILFDQAILNKGLQLLGDRILREKVYYALDDYYKKIVASVQAKAFKDSKRKTPEERAEWEQKYRQASVEMDEQHQKDIQIGVAFFELNNIFGKLYQIYASGSTYETVMAEADLRYAPHEKAIISRMEDDLQPYFNTNWKQIQSVLKPGEAYIEFIRIPRKDMLIYQALILKATDTSPALIHICNETFLSNLLGVNSTEESISDLYKNQALFSAIRESLSEYLNGIKTIYYVPAGLLHRLSFEAIMPDTIKMYRRISSHEMLKNEYQLAKMGERKFSLWGGIDYNNNRSGKEDNNAPQNLRRDGLYFQVKTMRGEHWQNLPGTQTEVDQISRILKNSKGNKINLYEQKSANESAFKSRNHLGKLESPEVLHLATHGFFYPVRPQKAKGAFFKANNPLLRSGLILAGANKSTTGFSVSQDQEDNILTAYEISNLDFARTHLAVLSACETGLGDIKADEGVYGLQRAFKMAGVNYLMMSLWKVPDKETAEMMEYFYTNLVKDARYDIQSAFEEAQKQMKARHPLPYYWAAFVLIK